MQVGFTLPDVMAGNREAIKKVLRYHRQVTQPEPIIDNPEDTEEGVAVAEEGRAALVSLENLARTTDRPYQQSSCSHESHDRPSHTWSTCARPKGNLWSCIHMQEHLL